MSPAPGFPAPPPQWYGPPGPCPRGGQGLHYHFYHFYHCYYYYYSYTARAPPTTTNAATTTAAAAAAAAATTTTTTIYYYILCLFLLPLLLLLLNPTMYVHMYAPTTGHRGGRIPWRGGEGGTSEAWLIYIYIYKYYRTLGA